MEVVADAVPELEGVGLKRFEAALARIEAPKPFDAARALALLEKAINAVS